MPEEVSTSILLYMSDYFVLTTTCLCVEPSELEKCNTRAFLYQQPLLLISVGTKLLDQIACLSVMLYVLS